MIQHPAKKKQEPFYCLVDCNNFYVSCERLFRPDLAGRPVVVLSNNDGCIIARSNEVKALGISMGSPYFKQEKLLRQHNVAVFSSNYPLYGDISQRVLDVLMDLEPDVEVYSIDEAFISLPSTRLPGALEARGRFLRETVQKYTGIPVSIGFGPTRTLAKIANRFAKKSPAAAGVFVISDAPQAEALLAGVDVGAVWGIGRRQAALLKKYGIDTALKLRNCDTNWLRKQLTVTGLRTAMELRGVPCISPEKAEAARQSVCTSRSFGQPVLCLEDLREAVASYTVQAAAKLRRARLRATVIDVFIRTNSFRKKDPQYCSRKSLLLEAPSSHTGTLIRAALASLAAIYRPGYRYHKAGVLLHGLVPESHEQLHLFRAPTPRSGPLMEAVDAINSRWGRETIQPAAAGLARQWRFRQTKKSPSYTTRWSELPVAKASSPEGFSMA